MGLVELLIAVVGGQAAVAWGAWSQVTRGIADGDRPGDPSSRVRRVGGGSIEVTVGNPSDHAVTVAWRPTRLPLSWAPVGPPLGIRAAHRADRRDPAHEVAGLLGAVGGHGEASWTVERPGKGNGVRILLGLPGGRLRVHEHSIGRPPDRLPTRQDPLRRRGPLCYRECSSELSTLLREPTAQLDPSTSLADNGDLMPRHERRAREL